MWGMYLYENSVNYSLHLKMLFLRLRGAPLAGLLHKKYCFTQFYYLGDYQLKLLWRYAFLRVKFPYF